MVSWVFNYVYVMTNGQGGPGDAEGGRRPQHLPSKRPRRIQDQGNIRDLLLFELAGK